MIGEKFSATYIREIERKPMNNVLFFGGFAVLTFLVVFIFGIRPTALALAQNNSYKKELVDISKRMETKLEQIQAEETKLTALGTNIQNLDKAIPNDIYMQEFLQEVVIESAKSGFVVLRVKQADIMGDEIPVDLEMSGHLTGLGGLLENMEKMRRFVNVLDVRLDVEEGVATVKLRVTIYKI